MAARNKSTMEKAQAGLSRALKDFEKTIMGMVRSSPAKKAPKPKRAKKKSRKK